MAYLIPENAASRSDIPASLQAVAAAVRDDLPDEVTVWLDQEEDADPYLIVLDPASGIVLLHAPRVTARDVGGGLFARRNLNADLPSTLLERAHAIGRRLDGETRLPEALRAATVIAAPQLTRGNSERLAADADDVFTEEDFAEGMLRDALRRALSVNGRGPLTDREERVARGLIRPEIVISGGFTDEDNGEGGQLIFRPPDGEEDAIRVLDRQQERLAHHLGEGYRVIRGVAGSGKTLVLTFRAKWYAEHFPNRRVLLTCYNVPLAKALAQQLASVPSVDVKTVDGLAHEVRRAHRSSWRPDDAAGWTRAREEATAFLRKEGGLYDVVLVDEGQDLDTAGLDLAFAALKRGRSDFLVALDGAQNVYRKTARWNPPDQSARGRTTVLRLNYRNTREILEFACRFLGGGEEMPAEEQLDDPTAIVPPEATSRRGPRPRVVVCRDATQEAETIVGLMKQEHDRGVAWRDMVVLYGSAKPWQTKLWTETKRLGVPYFWVSMNGKTKRQVVEVGDVVRCATLQGLKGLEFSRVFMCGVNDVYDPGGTDPDTVRRIVYVAMTRAMDELTVTVSGNGPVGDAIQRAASG